MRRLFKIFGALFGGLALAFAGSWLITMPNSTERGVWQHVANGNILSLTRLRADLYHATAFDCTINMSFPAHLALVEALEGASITAEGDQLTLTIAGNLETYDFTRIDALPDSCTTDLPATPHNVFMALWTAMDEHYPFFDLYGVDWQDRRALAPAPDAQMADADLFALLEQALTGLDDGHVHLVTEEFGISSPSVPPAWLEGSGLTRETMNDVMRANAGVDLTPIDKTGLEYGLRDDGIGVVLITYMSTDPGFGQSGPELASNAFAQIATAFAEARGIVIDVRTNPGGDDSTALAYASHLTAATVPALIKRTKQGDGWTDPVTAGVTPADDTLLAQPIVLLTSTLTGSGAEIFTMALREMPQVTVMGENTGGGLSDVLGITLPNGWRFGMSHQEYLTPDGTLYEGVGLPPDIPLAFDAAPLIAGNDPVLQAAIAHLAAR